MAAAQTRWPDVRVLPSVLALEEDERCVIIGTLYKIQSLKPSILKQLAEDAGLIPQPPPHVPPGQMVADSDEAVLEDDQGRVPIIGKLDVGLAITGIVVALLGRQSATGSFTVEDWCFSGLPPQPASLSSDPPVYVALISGLNIGASQTVRLQLLADWLCGHVGGGADQAIASRVVRLIVAGNSLSPETVAVDEDVVRESTIKPADRLAMTAPLSELDAVLAQISASLPVDLLPGENDPTNFSMPQQPLNAGMFPLARRLGNFQPVSNPYTCVIDGLCVAGTSGQPIEDIQRYSTRSNVMEVMAATLHWRHFAPTAPDTLTCYPFEDRDPFVITDCPHLYFAGAQPQFQSQLMKGSGGQIVRLVALPSFAKTGVVALVNLRTLDCHAMALG